MLPIGVATGSGLWTGVGIGLLASGSLTAVAGIIAYRRLQTLERRARDAERLAELGTLTGGLAHEIKNPLSTVQLNLQLLQEDITPDNAAYSRIASRLNTVKNETVRLREILDDFLRYAGRIELEKHPLELGAMLEELVDFYLPQTQIQRVQLRLDRGSSPVVVNADVKLLKQAILNLMINALQAMPDGGELILRLSADRQDARIDVIDTGPGIPPEAVTRIFQAYYTTKRGGTGLGLAMARRIIQEHGGQLSVRSEPGKGSDFTLLLPIA
ncbi:MAG: two-component sensor histidine kinase [Phycisphaerae bacterium]|nr:two-component sensor histidine kinase [Phycisphaerae bacterium]